MPAHARHHARLSLIFATDFRRHYAPALQDADRLQPIQMMLFFLSFHFRQLAMPAEFSWLMRFIYRQTQNRHIHRFELSFRHFR